MAKSKKNKTKTRDLPQQKTIERQTIHEPGIYIDRKGRIPGLRLVVTPRGGASWLMRYWRDGRSRDLGLGSARDGRVKLKQARAKAAAARALLDAGVDPIDHKKAERATRWAAHGPAVPQAVTFKQAAERYYNEFADSWSSATHRNQFLNSMQNYVWPIIGNMPVAAVDKTAVLGVLEQPVAAHRNLPSGKFWTVRAVTAGRVRQRLEQVLGWATVRDLRTGDNPARWRAFLDKALPTRSKTKLEADGTVSITARHFEALPYAEIPAFLAALRAQAGTGARALEFALLTASRTGEVLGAKWNEIDFEKAVWVVPAQRMKGRVLHEIPLSDAAVELLQGLPRELGNDHVFVGPRRDRLADNSLTRAYRASGFPGSVHGMRSSFRDWAQERTNFAFDAIELCLAHQVGGMTERSYLRSTMPAQRRQLMDLWCDFCSGKAVQTGGEVIPIRG
jgi:integrase